MDNKQLLISVKNHANNLLNSIRKIETGKDIEGKLVSINNSTLAIEIEENAYISTLFIGICLNKIDQSKISDEHKGFCSAYRFLYNTIKHEKDPLDINFLNFGASCIVGQGIVGYMRLGMGPAVLWSCLELKNKKFKKQHNNYIDYLQNKELKFTTKKIIEIISNLMPIKC